LVLDNKRYLWRDILKMRREQCKAAEQAQPVLFNLQDDERPQVSAYGRGEIRGTHALLATSGIKEIVYVRCGNTGHAPPPMPWASNRNSKRRWRRTASRRHNAPKLRQVTILAKESLTTLPRFVASLSRRAAKRPFPAVGLNVAEGVESGYSIKPPECCQRAQKRTFAERAGP
jgi:hypothetical protein